ncbi:hypothetical protein LCGC14_2349080 [marine sediment metagenome]|uniref:Uncharacterized protein n=1 Tax=marine sediment metagenome TaxID=412755 RepID=A0A0F9F4S6_9ZZZZ
MLQDVLKIVESEIEVIRLDHLGDPLDHSTLDLLVDRIRLRVKEEKACRLCSSKHPYPNRLWLKAPGSSCAELVHLCPECCQQALKEGNSIKTFEGVAHVLL